MSLKALVEMSRRPISSQARAKPDVKSYPNRPQTTAPRQSKPLAPIRTEEEEYKRLNEELDKEFPEMSKQYEALMDPSNPFSLQDLFKKMGNYSIPTNPASTEDINETFNRLIPDPGRGEESVPNLDRLVQKRPSTETVDVISSLEEKGNECMKLNDELNKKNSSMIEDCRALLMKLNPGLEQNFEQEDEVRPEPFSSSTDLESFMAREKEYRRMDEELDKKNLNITKKAEALLAKQRKKDKIQTSKVSDKKPPQMSQRTRSIGDKPAKQTGNVINPNTAGTRVHSDESLEALREEIMSGTEFSDVIRRIEERVLKINDYPDQPTPDNQPVDTAKEQLFLPQQSELDTGRAGESRDNTPPLARPSTAPGPIPRKTGIRASDPIRDIEPPEEVGAEAMQRFLKAKLNVLKEELDRASEEIAQKDAELQECKKELLSKQEQNLQLDKQATSLRSQSDKQQKKLELVTNELDNSKLEVSYMLVQLS